MILILLLKLQYEFEKIDLSELLAVQKLSSKIPNIKANSDIFGTSLENPPPRFST